MAPPPIRAIAFDAFGTLIDIDRAQRPLAPLMTWLRSNNRLPELDEFAPLMRQRFKDATAGLPAKLIQNTQNAIEKHAQTIIPFPDAMPTLTTLREKGCKTAICSNLIELYGRAVARTLPHPWHTAVWSFDAGAIKPEPAIFQALCQSLDTHPEEVLFVGDSLNDDYLGARQAGLQARWLRRGYAPQAPNQEIAKLSDILKLV